MGIDQLAIKDVRNYKQHQFTDLHLLLILLMEWSMIKGTFNCEALCRSFGCPCYSPALL